jgi:hypothetical protein
MPSLAKLTGRWVGSYTQGGEERPISADLVQEGVSLKGSMRDGQPDRECSLFEGAMAAGLPPGTDEQIDAKLRSMVPDAGTEPIRWVSHLAEESLLEGHCDGQDVSFVKTYAGPSFSGYRVGDKMVGTEVEGHAVNYQGQLNRDGSVIEGRWWIDADPVRESRRTQGLFILRREVREP